MKNIKQTYRLLAGLIIALSLVIGFSDLSQQNIKTAFAQEQCTDPEACNSGNFEDCDYSCLCNDMGACNYGAVDACEYTSCRCNDMQSCNPGGDGVCEYESCAIEVCSDDTSDTYVPPPYVFPFTGVNKMPPCVYYEEGCSIPQCANFDPQTQVPVSEGGHVPNDDMCEYAKVCTIEKDGEGVPYQNYESPPIGPCDVENSNVCIAGIAGCTDPDATNYDPDATYDDGSCTGDDCPVITNVCCSPTTGGIPNINYNPAPGDCDVCSDSTCITTVPILGCTNTIAYNYNSSANTDDGSCFFSFCELSVEYQFNSIVASSTYSGSMAVRVNLSTYDITPTATACDDLPENEDFVEDIESIIEIIQLAPAIYPPVVCDDCIFVDLTERDLCLDDEHPGNQPIVPYGFTRSPSGDCTPDVTPDDTSMCGTATLGDPTYGGAYMNASDIPVGNLCTGTSTPSAVTRFTLNSSKYKWSCTNLSNGESSACEANARCGTDGMYLCPTGTAQAGSCQSNSAGCDIVTVNNNIIIKTINVRPRIVRDVDTNCGLYFTTDTTDPEAEIACTLDDAPLTQSATLGQWNTTMSAGDHSLRCIINNETTEATTTRCILNPKYNEF